MFVVHYFSALKTENILFTLVSLAPPPQGAIAIFFKIFPTITLSGKLSYETEFPRLRGHWNLVLTSVKLEPLNYNTLSHECHKTTCNYLYGAVNLCNMTHKLNLGRT